MYISSLNSFILSSDNGQIFQNTFIPISCFKIPPNYIDVTANMSDLCSNDVFVLREVSFVWMPTSDETSPDFPKLIGKLSADQRYYVFPWKGESQNITTFPPKVP